MDRLRYYARIRQEFVPVNEGDLVIYENNVEKRETSDTWVHEPHAIISGRTKKRIDLEPYELRFLPDRKDLTSWSIDWLIPFLEEYNIAIYDPTNGAVSRGDIVRWKY